MNTFRWMSQFTQSPNAVLWEGEGEAGGAAVPTPSAAPATPAPATSGAPAAAAATPTPTPQAPATGAPEGWVPSYRLREVREAATREASESSARQVAAAQAEIERYKNLVRAQIGDTPPQNQEVQQVRDQFGKLYPGLAQLEERAAQLQELIDRA